MLKLLTDENYEFDFAPLKPILEQIKADGFGGWTRAGVDLEEKDKTGLSELDRIKQAAKTIQKTSDYLVCIGIGGSYLGHRAVVEALAAEIKNQNLESSPENPSEPPVTLLFAGNSLSEFEIRKTLETLKNHDFSINVISKSGTTTEPAVAFRIFKKALIEKYGEEEAKRRIYATTDAKKGALHDEAVQKGYTTFVVPDDIGGRYSVLTAVGLLPIAAAGIDIDALLSGARDEARDAEALSSDAYRYALLRARLAARGFDTEVLATFEPRLAYFNEWWKQLFGESEGKNEQGIFPASVVYTTDLHSLGQFMQQGRRDLFETVIHFANDGLSNASNSVSADAPALTDELVVPDEDGALDGLTYLEGCPLSGINEKALEATISAHRAGKIPVFELLVEKLDTYNLGRLIFFFELSCAVSAMLQGVNPFDQPGVEQYKTEMFRLLGKPGF